MSGAETLALALRLWPAVRDRGAVDDPADLDRLLDTQGRPGAPGYDSGQRHTFACFAPDEPAEFALPTGERPASDAEGRFVAHLLLTRTLVGAGLAIDEHVAGAMCDAYQRTWAARTLADPLATPLALALTLWLVVLDPLSDSDRPLPLDWSAACFRPGEHWDPDYPLVSHYDVREAALEWASLASVDPARRAGVSIWTMVEPLLRVGQDQRARLALAKLGEASDAPTGERLPAAAVLERNRVAGLLRAFLAGG